jgi:hypothetical protein
VTLYEIGTIKPVRLGSSGQGAPQVRNYVSVDGGMSDNIRTALYDASYTCVLANRASDAPPALCRVVGKHCESGDVLVRDLWLPADVQPGDLLAVAATGAYCWSMASNYNYLLKPPVVAGAGRRRHRGRPASDTVGRVRPRRRPRRRPRPAVAPSPARAGAPRGGDLVTQPLRVALLGAAPSAARCCGCSTSRRRPHRPHRPAGRGRRRRGPPSRPAPRRPAHLLTTDAHGLVTGPTSTSSSR